MSVAAPHPTTTMHVMGIDGCPAGWFIVETDEHGEYGYRVVESIASVIGGHNRPTLALVDMPIGLLERPGQRTCDRLARRALSPHRHASVFTPPSRQALVADGYEDANERNRAAVGKGLSRQTWHIIEKIRELDRLLRDTPSLQGIIREAHPEIGFWGLAGEPMPDHKGTETGRTQRLDVLTSIDITADTVYADACDCFRRRSVGRDDIIDALCLATVAARGWTEETLGTLPADPPTDPKGLPQEMVYWPKAPGTDVSSLVVDS